MARALPLLPLLLALKLSLIPWIDRTVQRRLASGLLPSFTQWIKNVCSYQLWRSVFNLGFGRFVLQ